MANLNYLYREKMNFLKKWKESDRRKPLMMFGARQVGKTSLLKQFGKEYYKKCCYVSFYNNDRMKKLFSNPLDIEKIISGLNAECEINITKGDTLIILDEIQECKEAIDSLKTFCEEYNDYHVVCAGSFLGLLFKEGQSFPVGKVNQTTLYPLSFKEFLIALNKKELVDILDNLDYDNISVFEDKFEEYLKYYMFVGGMPEVVASFAKNKNFIEAREIQEEIIAGYKNDFSKHAPATLVPKILEIWSKIPEELSRENKKFVFGLIKKGARAREYEIALDYLVNSGLCVKTSRIKENKVPLSSYIDYSAYKIYMFDIGILGALSKLRAKSIVDEDTIFVEFKGSLTENYVLLELMKNNSEDIYYWTNDNGISEVEFITDINEENIPVEAKAGVNVKSKSLKVFNELYSPKTCVRTSLKGYRVDNYITNIPLYLIGNIKQIVK
ncbi:MAG: AAA family ATPase [Clostridia bacterium]|nr:AAA family ATPase [Clostridia bacterium]